MESVYIETTILSYLVSRPSRDIIVAARQELTREWWTNSRPFFECVVSQIVLDEISPGIQLMLQNDSITPAIFRRLPSMNIVSISPGDISTGVTSRKGKSGTRCTLQWRSSGK